MELLDDDFDSIVTLEPSAAKRKVKFTGILGSPPKMPCPDDDSNSVSDAAEHQQRFSDTTRLSPYYSNVQKSNEKAKNLNSKNDTMW